MNEHLARSIQESVLCWLATVDINGMPNVSPKEIFTCFGDEIIIANIASPGSAKNIVSSGKACVSFVNVFTQRGFKVRGRAKALMNDDVGYDERYDLLYAMAGDKFPIMSVLTVSVESVQEILAPSYCLYPETTEESQIENAFEAYGVLRLFRNPIFAIQIQ